MTGEWALILAVSRRKDAGGGETVTNDEYVQALLAESLRSNVNFEAVVETEAIDGRSGHIASWPRKPGSRRAIYRKTMRHA